VEIAKLLCELLPFEFLMKRKSQKSSIVEILVVLWAIISSITANLTLGISEPDGVTRVDCNAGHC
jgi:hypothetical protein